MSASNASPAAGRCIGWWLICCAGQRAGGQPAHAAGRVQPALARAPAAAPAAAAARDAANAPRQRRA